LHEIDLLLVRHYERRLGFLNSLFASLNLLDDILLVGKEFGIDAGVLALSAAIHYHYVSSNHLPLTDEMRAIFSAALSLVVGSILYLFSRLYKVRKEMEKLVRDYIHISP
jgi:hypothetical protein